MDRSEGLLDSRALEEKTRWQRWRRHLSQDVDESWADLILLVLGFVAGIVDSAVFNVWSCFVSMQTGKLSVLEGTAVGYVSSNMGVLPRQHGICWSRHLAPTAEPAVSMGEVWNGDSELLCGELCV